MNIVTAFVCAVSLLGTQTPRPPVRLKIGDVVGVVTIETTYAGEYTVLTDGAIYGRGIGRLVVEGKTWDEVQGMIKRTIAKYIRPDGVSVVIKTERSDLVYLVGLGPGKGPIAFSPGMDLRQLLASTPLDSDADRVEAKLFRAGKLIATVNVADVLRTDSVKDLALKPDDVVSVSPVEFIRVWVNGGVRKPGELRLPAGTDVYRALSAAEGIPDEMIATGEARLVIRRGLETIDVPVRQDDKAPTIKLEANDLVDVVTPDLNRVTVAGEVNKPGEYLVRAKSGLLTLISQASGITGTGTLTRVMVFRKGEVLQLDASAPIDGGRPAAFEVQPGDVVYVRRNERAFYVLGEVNDPGKIVMEDKKTYRVTDALALAHGLSGKGTFRRAYLARPGPDGKAKIQEFNLDEFLKDGKLASNPEVLPGDSVLFGQPNGFGLASITQLLGSFVLINSVAKTSK